MKMVTILHSLFLFKAMAQSNEEHEMVNQQTNGQKGVFGWKTSKKAQKNEVISTTHTLKSKANSSIRRVKSATALSLKGELHHSAPHTYYNWRGGLSMRRIPDTIKEEGPEMTLTQFAAKYQNSLPQQVLVTRGVYSEEDEDSTVANSERLNIHFIRHRESVSVHINNKKTKTFKEILNVM